LSDYPLRIQKLQPQDPYLQPLLEEAALLLPGNEFDRVKGKMALEDIIHSSQGLVLRRQQEILAMLLYTIKESTCRVSFAYAQKEGDARLLLFHLLKGLVALAELDGELSNIRCDVVAWFPDSLEQALQLNNFTRIERKTMRRVAAYPTNAPPFPPAFRQIPWDTWLTTPASQILHLAFGAGFEGSWDRSLTEMSGCKQFLSDCYTGRYGTFDPAISFALQYENMWAGIALASWSNGGEGFIPAFGLLPQYTGKGIGSIMLHHLLLHFGRSHFPPPAIELAVSKDNKPAVALYEKFGFSERSRFYVYYRDIKQLSAS